MSASPDIETSPSTQLAGGFFVLLDARIFLRYKETGSPRREFSCEPGPLRSPMVLQKLVMWMRNEVRRSPGQNHLARWVGRNWARLSYAVHVEPTWLEVNRHDIVVEDLPADFDGLRIVQMSDF